MKDLAGAAYRVLVGALIVPALYFTLFHPGPAYLLLVPTAMAAAGVLLAGLRDSWALLAGFGGFPAAWLTFLLLQEALRFTWSCSGISFEPSGEVYGYGSSGGEEVVCGTIPASSPWPPGSPQRGASWRIHQRRSASPKLWSGRTLLLNLSSRG